MLPTKTKLLIVEDNKEDKELLMNVLERFHFDLTSVETGLEAKQMFGASDLDAVLMDMKLPDMDGLHLIRWFRSKRPEVPIAIVTGTSSIDDRTIRPKLYEAGAVMLFYKPFTSADNMGLLALLEVTKAARLMGRKEKNRVTTLLGIATLVVGAVTLTVSLVNHERPDWPLVIGLTTTGIGLIGAADAARRSVTGAK